MRPRHILCGLGAIGLGAVLLESPEGTVDLPSRLARLGGPIRQLPVPFLWDALGEARMRQDDRAALEIGRWLQRLQPESELLTVMLARQLAFNLALSEEDPEGRIARLRDALVLLGEGMREHPGRPELPALAAFLIQERTRRRPEATVFEEQFGEEPELAASRYYLEAARRGDLEPGEQFLRLLLGVRLVGLGERDFAAEVFHDAARKDPGQRSKLLGLAAALEAGWPLELEPELEDWLKNTEPFSRESDLWDQR